MIAIRANKYYMDSFMKPIKIKKDLKPVVDDLIYRLDDDIENLRIKTEGKLSALTVGKVISLQKGSIVNIIKVKTARVDYNSEGDWHFSFFGDKLDENKKVLEEDTVVQSYWDAPIGIVA